MKTRRTIAVVVSLVTALGLGSCRRHTNPPPLPQTGTSPPSTPPSALSAGALRVCSDPNNLPFSNDRHEGFENKLADLVARELGAHVEYTWWAQRRGFFRNTLRAGTCDVVMGVPTSFEMALTTRPYYRSTYVFVTRARDRLALSGFDDPRLRRLKIGVHMVGDDATNTPPAHALSSRGIVENVSGYTLYGDYSQPNPPARLIEAVADRAVDVAVAWGPFGGYFATTAHEPLRVTPVNPQVDLPFLPFVYDISMGVRRGDTAFRDRLDDILVRRRADIDALLASYHVPRADLTVAPASGADGEPARRAPASGRLRPEAHERQGAWPRSRISTTHSAALAPVSVPPEVGS